MSAGVAPWPVLKSLVVRRMLVVAAVVCSITALTVAASAAPVQARTPRPDTPRGGAPAAIGAGLFAPAGLAPATIRLGASSSLLGGLLGGPPKSLDEALNPSLPSLLQALLCPIVGTVGDVTHPIPGIGVLTSQLSSVACSVSILGYAYRTTYIRPDGHRVVRYSRALAAVPRLLDVDGDGSPDFAGTISPNLSLDGVNLNITRINFPASAKVSIEAVLINPATPHTFLGFGEDGTAAGTAGSWTATVNVFGLSGGKTDLGLTLASSNAPSTLTTIGEVFSGASADNPSTISRGRVGFSPVPAAATSEIRLAGARQDAIVRSTTPTKVTGQVSLIVPGNEKTIDATIDRLPSSIDVFHETQNGHELASYAAGGTIAGLTAAYHERAGDEILTAARVDAADAPARAVFDQAGERTSVEAPGGAFGRVEARFGSHTEVPAPGDGDGPYVAFHRSSPSVLTAGVRVSGLRRIAVSPGSTYEGRLTLAAPLPAIPLSAEDDVEHIDLSGSLTGVPLDTTLALNLGEGVLNFDGHGSGIDQIAVRADKTNGTFFQRASRIEATLDGIPDTETVSFKQVPGTLTATASAPLAKVSLLASDGSPAPAAEGSIASLEDTPARYRAFARIAGLKGLSFAGDPAGGSIDTVAPQVLDLHADTGDATFDGTVDRLAAHVAFALAKTADGGQTIDYLSSSPVDRIRFDASGAGLSLPAGATRVHGEVDGLPAHMTLTIPKRDGVIAFDPHGDHIARVLVQAAGAEGPLAAEAGHQLLAYDEAHSQVTVDLHQVGAVSATQTTTPLRLSYDLAPETLDLLFRQADGTEATATIADPRPADVVFNAAGDDLRGSFDVHDGAPDAPGSVITLHAKAPDLSFDGAIDRLPPHLAFAMRTDFAGNKTIDYTANGVPVDRITFDAGGSGLGLPLGAKRVRGQIDHLTGALTVAVPKAGGTIRLDAHGDHVGRVLAQAFGDAGPIDAEPGHQLLAFDEAQSRLTVDLRNVGNASATTSASPLSASYDIGSAPLDLDVRQSDGTFATGAVSNPQPASISVVGSGKRMNAQYHVNTASPNFNGDGSIDDLVLRSNASGGFLSFDIKHVPANLTLCTQQAGATCLGDFVPQGPAEKVDGHVVPPSNFFFQLHPTNLQGQPPAERVTVDGRLCPEQPNADSCLDASKHDERVVIDDLAFSTVEAGYGLQDDGCTVACGRVWAAFNTGSAHINGRVQFFNRGESQPAIDFVAPEPSGFLAADRFFFFVHYDAVSLDPVDVASRGALQCGNNPKPKAEIEINNFRNIDALGGTFGVCP